MADQTTTSSTDGSQYHWALQRIRAEYDEMPGLRLTAEQVARLCGIESFACHHLLDALVDTGYLDRAANGHYVRPAEPRRRESPAFARGGAARRAG